MQLARMIPSVIQGKLLRGLVSRSGIIRGNRAALPGYFSPARCGNATWLPGHARMAAREIGRSSSLLREFADCPPPGSTRGGELGRTVAGGEAEARQSRRPSRVAIP